MAHGAPEVVQAVKSGELTLNAARQIVVAVPKDDQPALVEKVIESSQGKKRHTPVERVLEGVDVRLHRAVPKDKQPEIVERVIGSGRPSAQNDGRLPIR